MRQFGSSGFRLWNLGVEAKLLYTAFCVLTMCGIVSSALYYEDLVGTGLRGVRRYYAGAPVDDAVPAAAPAPPGAGGPAIDVAPEAEEAHQPMVVAVTYRKLLEVTHFHLFTMPVVLLIVGHLFFACGLGARARAGWVAAGCVSVALHIATPWLVRYASPRLAFLHTASGLALTLSMGVLTGYPVIAMWRKAPPRGEPAVREG
jgi:hypothetical protein